MGYRLYLGSFPKERLDHYLSNYKIGELDRKMHDEDGEETDLYNEFWDNFDKYFECSNFTDFCHNLNRDCIDFTDENFIVVTKDNLLEYLQNFGEYYGNKCKAMQDSLTKLIDKGYDGKNVEIDDVDVSNLSGLLHILRMNVYHYKADFKTSKYVSICDVSDNKFNMTTSSLTKDFIYNIVSLVKNFEWDKNYLILHGR